MSTFYVKVKVTTNNNTHSSGAQSLYEFIVQEVIDGKRKSSSKYMMKHVKLEVVSE